MKGLLITVVGGVAVALIVGYFNDWFGIGGAPNRVIVRVIAFNQFGDRIGVAPTATITVENEGKRTAENCVVHWRPGMLISAQLPDEETTVAFGLDGAQSQTVNLTSKTAYGTRGTFTATAWISCSNSTSPPVTASVFVFT